MKKISNQTLYRYSFLGELKSNPSGDRAVFLRKTANKEENSYNSNIYLYQDKGVQKLTSCDTAANLFWLDDDNLVFSSERAVKSKSAELECEDKKADDNKKSKKDEKEKQSEDEKKIRTINLFKKDLSAQTEAEFFVELKGAISGIETLDNNRLIYLKTRDIEEKDSEYFAAQQNENGFMRIRRIPFYSNGGDFSFDKITTLQIFDIASKTEKEVEVKDYSIVSFEFNRDKTKALLLAVKLEKRYSTYTALFEYDIASGKVTKLLDDDKYSIKNPYAIYVATYLDNKPFFLGSTMQKHGLNENRIACVIENGEVKVLNGDDNNYLNSGVQDMELIAGTSFKAFDKHIDFITSHGTETKISRLSVDGKLEAIFDFKGSIGCFDYIGEQRIFSGLTADGGQEIYLDDKKISDFHEFLKEYYVAKPQALSLQSTDFEIEGFVLLPEDYDKKEKVAAVLEIHGGPKTAYQHTYFHEMQMLVAEGYLVMYCNPRGSAAYGDEFSDIYGLYGKVDYQNIMDFVDTVLAKYHKIDDKRLFVTGGSYGGFMTNFIVTHNNRFKAAVTQRSICNWMSMYGTSDIGYYFNPDQQGTSIEKETFWQDMWEVSPLKYVDNVQTPTMVIHSDKDYRCPVEQGYQFFTALLDRGVESEFLLFKNEHHGLSRVGKPKNRIERLEAIKTWFKTHDQE